MAAPRNPRDDALLSLAAGPKALAAAVARARSFALGEHLDDESSARLSIVVEEIVANLLDHARLGEGARFALELARFDNTITVVLTDPGTPFDPRIAPPSVDPPPARGGGAGLALVRAWCRIVAYERSGTSNRLVLKLDCR